METNFNLNRKPVPDEEINSHKDFGELVKKFKQQSIEKAKSDKSFIKNKKITYSTIIAGATVLCTITYFSVFKNQPPTKKTDDKIITSQKNNTITSTSKANSAFIAPPISKLNVPYTTYKVNAQQGATLKHPSKSKITVPKNAFVNKQGQDIVGDVEIKYREFHNQADIIVSGIPMAYDSAGTQFHLESAGMIDVKGFQNGEPVFIKPQKQIRVEFSSEHTADKYNMYSLDTVAKNWVYLGRDNSLINSKFKVEDSKLKIQDSKLKVDETPQLTALKKQLDAIPPKVETEKIVYTKKVDALEKPVTPTKPVKASEGLPKFELDVDYKEFPELAAFKNALFEIGRENKNFDPKLAEITWNSADIAEGPQKGKNYLLTLKQLNRVEKLIVYPSLMGADYEKAINAYEQKFTDYKKRLEKRQADEQKLKEEFEAKQATLIAEQKRLQDQITKEQIRLKQQQAKQLEKQFASIDAEERVTRVFQISSFGIFNSDCPNSLPQGATKDVVYMSNGLSLTPTLVMLVCHNKNMVYRLYKNLEKLNYNPIDKYSLCVLVNDKMYVCDKEALSKHITKQEKNIDLKELGNDMNDVASFKKELGI